jgi:fructose-1,6-bisphosphatase I
MSVGMTLSRHIIAEEHKHTGTTGEFSSLLEQVAFAGKLLAREINRAALSGKLGTVGEVNPTGDVQKKLDVIGNEIMMDAFARSHLVAGIASEELKEAELMSTAPEARYLLCMDPLDGSSNTDVNAPLGTIFGIYRRLQTGPLEIDEFLQVGSKLIAAGYILYGTSTVLVYSVGHGVYGFTLDQSIGEFILSHENIRCPKAGQVYSANVGRHKDWEPGVQQYLDYITDRDKASGRPHSLRYTGALVADLHRCLLDGGIYFYPADPGNKNGKLRLLYECAPLGYVAEQAGGLASTGRGRVLEVKPESIHQRTPVAIGSAENVSLYEKFVAEAR